MNKKSKVDTIITAKLEAKNPGMGWKKAQADIPRSKPATDAVMATFKLKDGTAVDLVRLSASERELHGLIELEIQQRTRAELEPPAALCESTKSYEVDFSQPKYRGKKRGQHAGAFGRSPSVKK